MPVASDALVFFGATGDLAYKQIFPALQAMVRRGSLHVPVIGVARSGWGRDQLVARAHDSLAHHAGTVDEDAFGRLKALLRYVDGDYRDPATFDRLRQALGPAQHPLHYFAIPPRTTACARSLALLSIRCTTSPSRRACSKRWPKGWRA